MIKLVPFLAFLSLLLVPSQDPEEDALTLTFAWPLEGEVQVRESSLKKGNTSETAYTLRWRPDESGEAFVIGYEDFRFLSMNGMDASTPQLKAVIERVGPLLKAIPRMRIAASGELIELLGMDEVFEAVLAELPEDQRDPQLEAMMRSAEARQLASKTAAERWSVWVAGLIGTETFPGDEWEADIEMPSNLPDRTLVAVQTFRCTGRLEEAGADCVRLEMTTSFDPASLKANTLAVAESLGSPFPPEVAETLELTRQDRVEGVWEIGTLRPHRVTTSTVVSSAGQEQREEHRYVFDWSGGEDV